MPTQSVLQSLRYLSLPYFNDFHLTVADTKVRFLRAAVKGRFKKSLHLTLIVIKNILFWTPYLSRMVLDFILNLEMCPEYSI